MNTNDNIVEHKYNTRNKHTNMNTQMNTQMNTSPSCVGVNKAIKVYNIKRQELVSDFSDSTKLKVDMSNKRVRIKSAEIDPCKGHVHTDNDNKIFTLSYLINKMNTLSNDTDEDDEDYVPSDEEVHCPLTKKVNKKDKIKYKKYKKKNERSFFNSLDEKDKLLYNSLEDSINEYRKNTIPLRFKILKLDIPIYTKNYIIEKIDQFAQLDSGDNEYHKLNTWLQNLIKIPFGEYIKPTITHNSSSTDIAEYIQKAQKILNNEVYGHKDAKDQIIEIIASQISNPDLQGVAIGIKGPPGNGKTTLIKNGISKALERPFRLIGLGGSSSSDFLVGHDYTYEGSIPGKIVQVLQESRCMNPIIYFDELDKVSDTAKGEEIINLLCHLVDTSQNTHFSDKYFSGIDIDMSRVLFVFSYNDESKISPILLDRFIKITTNKFNKDDKQIIANDYLIPSICKNINFVRENISFTNECLEYIITTYTKGEKGVRNLRRYLEKVITRINILHLLTNYSGNIEDIIPYSITDFSLPIVITKTIVDHIIKIKDEDKMDPSLFGLYS